MGNVSADRQITLRQPATNLRLVVLHGDGDGVYDAGDLIPIDAGDAPDGYHFSHWSTSGGGQFADARAGSTTFTMPATTVSITAHYLPGAPPGANVSAARRWIEVLLQAIRNDYARPTVHARNLFHISAAMYDAWAAYDPSDQPASPWLLGRTRAGSHCGLGEIPIPEDVEDARQTALSYAVYRLIRHRFDASPGAGQIIRDAEALMGHFGYDVDVDDTDLDLGPAALGNHIGRCYIDFGLVDGANEVNDYANVAYETGQRGARTGQARQSRHHGPEPVAAAGTRGVRRSGRQSFGRRTRVPEPRVGLGGALRARGGGSHHPPARRLRLLGLPRSGSAADDRRRRGGRLQVVPRAGRRLVVPPRPGRRRDDGHLAGRRWQHPVLSARFRRPSGFLPACRRRRPRTRARRQPDHGSTLRAADRGEGRLRPGAGRVLGRRPRFRNAARALVRNPERGQRPSPDARPVPRRGCPRPARVRRQGLLHAGRGHARRRHRRLGHQGPLRLHPADLVATRHGGPGPGQRPGGCGLPRRRHSPAPGLHRTGGRGRRAGGRRRPARRQDQVPRLAGAGRDRRSGDGCRGRRLDTGGETGGRTSGRRS